MPDLRPQLECAISAALKAGAMLRDEFHRPGGPRGAGDHAAIDEPAERAIHDILLGAFPDYGYLGEELRDRRRQAELEWVVDPNDGTSTYVKGQRGSAVSIALLRNGQPVLGVVYAPCAPDDSGDLFAWAEGCGPLRRNGAPVAREWPGSVSPDLTVLVPPAANRLPTENAALVSPMRFRTFPSIAYRLALVAAGEADGTLSINNVALWDYAAGAALIRGAEGEFRKRGPFCYGGARCVNESLDRRVDAFVAAIAARPQLRGAALCWPKSGSAVRDAGVLCRAQGCLFGQLAGDSLGSLVEFHSPETIRRRYAGGVRQLADGGPWDTIAGQPTDDSEMALALARTLVAGCGFDASAVRSAYDAWRHSRPFDIGNTTRQGLAGSPNPESQANGALMRISPLGIYGWNKPVESVEAWASEDAAITHPHPLCSQASAVFASTLAHAIRTAASPAGVHAFAAGRCRAADVSAALASALEAAADRPPDDYLTHAGWVLVAFQNAFWQLLHASTFEEGVVDTVSRGGDTDTNAAIAGALLGAVHGRAAIPLQWIDRVLTCRPMQGLAAHPRPEQYWPVDAPVLAERLLTV